ncbi:MAG TPA: hypothetical protein VHC69_23000 [Polyangiaceae bacterium]|nr:hypothetical protein [Polyangiaceae bacterium]
MASFLVRSLLSAAGIALVAVACGDSFRSAPQDGGTGNGGTDASINDTGGASSGGPSSGGATGDGGRMTSGGASGSTAPGGSGGTSRGGAPASTSGGRPSPDAGDDADAASGGVQGMGGKPATGGASAHDAGGPTIPMNGLVLWLRADKGVTSSNGLVSRWADQSPSHLDATQATASMQPQILPQGINGHPALVFDGTDDFLQITKAFDVETGAVTVLAVVQTPNADACASVFESSNGTEDNDIEIGSYMQKVNWEIKESDDENATFDEGVPLVVSGSVDADGDGYVVHDGVVASTITDFLPPAKLPRLQTFIGNTLYASCQTYPGRIGEIVVYSRALSLEETLAVQKYLGDEFDCCVN